MTPANSAIPCGLFIFTRFPVPGRTKTRLIPLLGPAGAAQLQKQMTEHLLTQFHTIPNLSLQVHYTGGTLHQMYRWLGNNTTLIQQGSGDLGQRLTQALHQGFVSGLRHILIVGSDCPSLTQTHITEALLKLQTHDLVIGPATDGGYYLIGLKRLHSILFKDILWGSDRVLTQTQSIAHQHHLSTALLPPLSDIDRPEDLPIWHQIIAKEKAASQSPITDNK
ncbi:MAG: TIGR04282 family arsenosugar biosynthesis glycosyltransferase [Cyanobacteria bacterium P01_D01_bin.36]